MASAANLATIDETTLRDFCNDRARESLTLEFKRELPARSDKGRAEFLKDVTALANTSGGDLIYGLAESDGAASDITPIVEETFDEAQRRLAQSVIASIEPPLRGLQFHEIQVSDGWCLLIRVPSSFAAPHRYSVGGVSRFALREPGFVREMSYSELSGFFTRIGQAATRSREFRQRRVDEILKGQTWRPMDNEPLGIVQIMPLSAFSAISNLDLLQTYGNWDKFIQADWGGGSRTFNLDGLVVHPGGKPPLNAYVQIYRDGIIEGVFTAGHWSHENTIPSLSVANCIRATVFAAFAEYERQSFVGPVTVCVSLLKVRDHKLGIGSSFPSFRPLTSDRENLLLPDVLIEATGDLTITDLGLKQVLDVMWQCFGSAACNYYDADGNWSAPH